MRQASMTRSRRVPATVAAFSLLLVSGCSWQLQSVTGKTKFGPEFRRNSSHRNSTRWTSIEQEIELKWDNGWSTLLGYRRRDVDDGGGGDDNRFNIGFKYPIWKRSKVSDGAERRYNDLERRLTQLERENANLRGVRERTADQAAERGSSTGTN